MNNLVLRGITGSIFVIVLLSSIWFSQFSFAILFFLFTLIGTWEFYSLLKKMNFTPHKVYGTFIAGMFFIFNFFISIDIIPAKTLALFIVGIFFVFLIQLFQISRRPFHNIAYTILGIIYVGVPFSLLNYLNFPINYYSNEYNPQILIGTFFILWANDTGAYAVGSLIGKTKLTHISPKKTWEGTIGGSIIAIFTAYLLSYYFHILNELNWLIIGVIIALFGTLGDLVESQLKRFLGIKDSGKILPGHGGILDRFDGLLLSAPFIFVYLLFIEL